MTWNDVRRDERETAEEAVSEPPAPAPAVVPGSIEWASAVGNQAVARLAATQAGEQEAAPEEEQAPEGEAAPEEELPPEEAAALAEVDEEQLPE